MLSENNIKHILARVIANADEAKAEFDANREDAFNDGRSLAYYEVLDTVKSELRIAGADLKEFGLDGDLDNTYA